MSAMPGFLADLDAAAIAAQQEELRFSESVAAEIARREREREFAFRRANLARTMVAAAAGADSEEKALALQRASLKRELGWVGEAEPRKAILDAWNGVAAAIWRATPRPGAADGARAPQGAGVAAAFATFEAWFQANRGTPFLGLFDHEMPEIPVVEF